jgi:hypothetical protein
MALLMIVTPCGLAGKYQLFWQNCFMFWVQGFSRFSAWVFSRVCKIQNATSHFYWVKTVPPYSWKTQFSIILLLHCKSFKSSHPLILWQKKCVIFISPTLATIARISTPLLYFPNNCNNNNNNNKIFKYCLAYELTTRKQFIFFHVAGWKSQLNWWEWLIKLLIFSDNFVSEQKWSTPLQLKTNQELMETNPN